MNDKEYLEFMRNDIKEKNPGFKGIYLGLIKNKHTFRLKRIGERRTIE